MRIRALLVAVPLAATIAWGGAEAPRAQNAPLPAPSFHHLHLNSTNPTAAIDWYTKAFPSTSKTTWGGEPALKSPNNVLILFTKVDQPPAEQPQTAFWHFGWHVRQERATMARLREQGVTLVPLYTTDEGATVSINSDTWPGTGGVLGLTKAQIAEARKNNVQPAGGAGFAYIRGPDDALIEVQGDMPVERFNHVHMYHEQPACAGVWYQTHLNAPRPQGRRGEPDRPRNASNCEETRGTEKTWPALEVDGMYRSPSVAIAFGDVSMGGYMRQGDRPLVDTRGHTADHVGLGVADFDAWFAKLRAENVKILEPPHRVGEARAFMIQGPSKEAIEILEVK